VNMVIQAQNLLDGRYNIILADALSTIEPRLPTNLSIPQGLILRDHFRIRDEVSSPAGVIIRFQRTQLAQIKLFLEGKASVSFSCGSVTFTFTSTLM